MTELPRPEHFGAFRDWLEAARRVRGLNMGRAAVNKWYQGGNPDVHALQRIAVWAGLEYATLRLLVDGVPQPGSRRARVEVATRRSPQVELIASKLDQLADEEDLLADIEALLDARMNRRVGRGTS